MWQEWVLYWLSPFTVALQLWVAATVCLWLRRQRAALALSLIGLAGLWIGSTPALALFATRALESRYAALRPEATPPADAIVVLGGALGVAAPPARPTFVLTSSSTRIWHAAALYRHGKAPWVVVAAGNRPGFDGLQPEAEAISEMLTQLGVPASAIRRDTQSRTTRENAANALPLVQAVGAKKVLLVTSAAHMPRAMQTFEKMWAGANIQLIPAVTDVRAIPRSERGLKLWLPSLEALINVTKSLKEFAGMAALAIIL